MYIKPALHTIDVMKMMLPFRMPVIVDAHFEHYDDHQLRFL